MSHHDIPQHVILLTVNTLAYVLTELSIHAVVLLLVDTYQVSCYSNNIIISHIELHILMTF